MKKCTFIFNSPGTCHAHILTFDDPSTRLPAIDRLEAFRPGGQSLYKRVLVPIHVRESIVLAGLYTVYETSRRGMELILTGISSV